MNAIVVASTPCHDVQKYLRAAGSHITTAQDGQDAISHAAHASYDLAVLVSTGKGMDLVETYFNLRDINPWMEIIILSNDHAKEWDRTADVIARAFPNTVRLPLRASPVYWAWSEMGRHSR